MSSKTEGLSDASLPNKEDGVWRFRLSCWCLDDSLFEGLYVAGKYYQHYWVQDIIGTYLIVMVLPSFSSSKAYSRGRPEV